MERRCGDATVVIWQVSKSLPKVPAGALMKAIALLHQNMDHLGNMVDKVKDGRVVAVKSLTPEWPEARAKRRI